MQQLDCGFPPEYCELNGPTKYERCKVFLQEKHPELLAGVVETQAAPAPPAQGEEKKAGDAPAGEEEKKAEPAPAKPKKVSVKDVKQVTITKAARTKKKFLTIISGLDKFGMFLCSCLINFCD